MLEEIAEVAARNAGVLEEGGAALGRVLNSEGALGRVETALERLTARGSAESVLGKCEITDPGSVGARVKDLMELRTNKAPGAMQSWMKETPGPFYLDTAVKLVDPSGGALSFAYTTVRASDRLTSEAGFLKADALAKLFDSMPVASSGAGFKVGIRQVMAGSEVGAPKVTEWLSQFSNLSEAESMFNRVNFVLKKYPVAVPLNEAGDILARS